MKGLAASRPHYIMMARPYIVGGVTKYMVHRGLYIISPQAPTMQEELKPVGHDFPNDIALVVFGSAQKTPGSGYVSPSAAFAALNIYRPAMGTTFELGGFGTPYIPANPMVQYEMTNESAPAAATTVEHHGNSSMYRWGDAKVWRLPGSVMQTNWPTWYFNSPFDYASIPIPGNHITVTPGMIALTANEGDGVNAYLRGGDSGGAAFWNGSVFAVNTNTYPEPGVKGLPIVNGTQIVSQLTSIHQAPFARMLMVAKLLDKTLIVPPQISALAGNFNPNSAIEFGSPHVTVNGALNGTVTSAGATATAGIFSGAVAYNPSTSTSPSSNFLGKNWLEYKCQIAETPVPSSDVYVSVARQIDLNGKAYLPSVDQIPTWQQHPCDRTSPYYAYLYDPLDDSCNFSVSARITDPTMGSGLRFHSQDPCAIIAPVLTATAYSWKQINLSWTDATTDESGFMIERSLSSSGPWTSLPAQPANTTSYQDKGLAPNTRYYYRIRAKKPVDNYSSYAYANALTFSVPTCSVGLTPSSVAKGVSAVAQIVPANLNGLSVSSVPFLVSFDYSTFGATNSKTYYTTWMNLGTYKVQGRMSLDGTVVTCSEGSYTVTQPAPGCSINVSPSSVSTGQSVTATVSTWNMPSGAPAYYFSNAGGNASNSNAKTFSASQTAGSYSISASVTVNNVSYPCGSANYTVTAPAPSCSMTAAPSSVVAGQSISANMNLSNVNNSQVTTTINGVANGNSLSRLIWTSSAGTFSLTGSITYNNQVISCAAASYTVTAAIVPSCSISVAPASVSAGSNATATISPMNLGGALPTYYFGGINNGSAASRSFTASQTAGSYSVLGSMTVNGISYGCGSGSFTVTAPVAAPTCSMMVNFASVNQGQVVTATIMTSGAATISAASINGTALVLPSLSRDLSSSTIGTASVTGSITVNNQVISCAATSFTVTTVPFACMVTVTPYNVGLGTYFTAAITGIPAGTVVSSALIGGVSVNTASLSRSIYASSIGANTIGGSVTVNGVTSTCTIGSYNVMFSAGGGGGAILW